MSDSPTGEGIVDVERLKLRIAELEDALARSEERRRLLFRTLPQKVFFKDTQSRFLAVNESFAEEVGLTPDEMIGKSDFDFYPRELAEKYTQDDRRVMNSRSVVTLIERHMVGGEERTVEVTKAAVVDGAGQVVGLLGLFTDITERVRAEESIKRERHLLHALMNNIPDSIYFKDLESRFLRINRALSKRFGLNHPSEAVGKTDWDFFAEEHARAAQRDEQHVIRTGQPLIDKEEKESWEDGHVTWVSTTKMPLRDAAGAIVGTFGISRDITQRKRAEQELEATARELAKRNAELRASERRYRLLTEGTLDAVVVVNGQGLVTLFNPAAEKTFGYSADEIVGRHVRQLVPDDLYDGYAKLLESHLATPPEKREHIVELMGKKKDGSTLPIDLSLSALEIGEDAVFLGAIRDATERHQMQSRIVQVEKLTALGLISAGVAHEINNPLAYVSNNLAVIQRDVGDLMNILRMFRQAQDAVDKAYPDLGAQIAELAEEVDLDYVWENIDTVLSSTVKGVKRVADIVQNLRNFSRLDRAKIDRCNIEESLDASIEMIQARLRRQKIKLERDYGGVPQIICAPAQMNQVFMNLLVNAMQAVEASRRKDGVVAVRTWQENDSVSIAISDNGCGIPKDKVKHIFDPFFTTKEVGEGTGLGLSIIHSIINEHEGAITVDTAEGQGSTFTVELPIESRKGKLT